MLTPSLQDFSKMAEQGRILPLRRRIPADLETPVSVYLKLKGNGATFLLESVERGIQVGRYSFIGVTPFTTIKLAQENVEIKRGNELQSVPVTDRDPLSVLRDELERVPVDFSDQIPGPFAVYIGVEPHSSPGLARRGMAAQPWALPDLHGQAYVMEE